MKKLTWALLSLMLFLGMGTAFAQDGEGDGDGETPAITLPAPTFDPASGTVAPGQEIEITNVPNEYKMNQIYILYTTDATTLEELRTKEIDYDYIGEAMSGQTPLKAAMMANGSWAMSCQIPEDAPQGQITFGARMVLEQVISITESNYIASDLGTATYTVEGEAVGVPVPTFDPEAGAVAMNTTVTMQAGDGSAQNEMVYFVRNNANFDFTQYTTYEEVSEAEDVDIELGMCRITEAVTLTAATCRINVSTFAVTWSEKVSASYTIQGEEPAPATVDQPVITPSNASIKLNQKVTITCTTNGADIYYTLDKSDPKISETRTKYEAPFLLPENTPVDDEITIRAIAVKDGVYSDPSRSVLMVEEAGEDPDEPVTPITKPDAPKFEVNGEKVTDATLEVIAKTVEVKWIGEANEDYTVVYTLDGSEAVFAATNMTDEILEDANYWMFGDEAIDVTAPVTIKAAVAAAEVQSGDITWSDMVTLSLTLATPVKPEAPVFTPASGATVDFGAELTLTCATEDAFIYYTTDGTEPSEDNGNFYSSYWGAQITGTTVKAVAILDGVASDVVTATYKINPIKAELALTSMKDDTVGKNVGTGIEFSLENWQNYPATVYYTVDGQTEPSKAAYEAQADKENGAIKMKAVKWGESWGVYGPMQDAYANFISLTFTEATHLKVIGYITVADQEVVTPVIDQMLQIKAETNPTFSLENYAKVAVGDKLVIENPNVYPEMPVLPEYPAWPGEDATEEEMAAYNEAVEAWYDALDEFDEEFAAWQELTAPIPATQLYFSFDGTQPTPDAYSGQEFGEYDKWSVFRADEGANVTVYFQEDEQGLYAYVPVIIGSFPTAADTIRLGADGHFSVQVFAISTAKEEGGDDPMPLSAKAAGSAAFKYGSDFVAAYYTMNEEYTVETPEFSVAAGAVRRGTKVEITCATEDAVIYYTVDGTEPTALSTPYETAIVINEAMTVKAIAIKDGLKSEVVTAAYTIDVTANEDLELAGVSVYPNPSNGMFNLELPVAATVEVFMSNGMLYQRLSLGEGNTTLNINRSGIYFLRITGEGRTTVKRLIIK